MGSGSNGSSPIDAAIEATTPVVEVHHQVLITIESTGRHFNITFPPDLTPAELLEVVGWMTTKLSGMLQPQLLGPGGLPVPHVREGLDG